MVKKKKKKKAVVDKRERLGIDSAATRKKVRIFFLLISEGPSHFISFDFDLLFTSLLSTSLCDNGDNSEKGRDADQRPRRKETPRRSATNLWPRQSNPDEKHQEPKTKEEPEQRRGEKQTSGAQGEGCGNPSGARTRVSGARGRAGEDVQSSTGRDPGECWD